MENIDLLFVLPLVIGFFLDLLVGDPRWMPHPIRWFGSAISFFEKYLNKGKYRFIKGGGVALFLIGSTYLFFFASDFLLKDYEVAYILYASLVVFFCLANRTLIAEVLLVDKKLSVDGLQAGRHQLSYIVGRDTSNLSENKIRTAALETLSENLSDGVIAPMFFYAVGGFPLMMAYKMVNTLDSMIGYKNNRYKQFGCMAARIDDVANFIPSRLTALLMVTVSFSWRGLRFLFQYGHKHSSPNSGYPESALAGILNCQFGGPNVYHGKLVDKPFIGTCNRIITSALVKRACLINLVVSIVTLALIVTVG